MDTPARDTPHLCRRAKPEQVSPAVIFCYFPVAEEKPGEKKSINIDIILRFW
jgi:hypothetical protein